MTQHNYDDESLRITEGREVLIDPADGIIGYAPLCFFCHQAVVSDPTEQASRIAMAAHLRDCRIYMLTLYDLGITPTV